MTTSNASIPTSAPASGVAQYLSFALAGEEYAVDILSVQEIRGICPITALPHASHEVRGVMNLRGAVVPVIDMRAALGLPAEAYAKFTVIIVVSVRGQTMGFVVDGVSDVLSVERAAIEPVPELGGRVDSSFASGIARAGERFIILLDIDRISSASGGAS